MVMAKLLFPAFLLVASLLPVMAQDAEAYSGTVMAEEGAWCWFADPRALHYENEAGTINASYIGYIDVHGNVKAIFNQTIITTLLLWCCQMNG